MEQLCGSMAMMDNEGFIRVLGDLMAQNKGFQIMCLPIRAESVKRKQ